MTAFEDHYPPSVFTKMWERDLKGVIEAGSIAIPPQVYAEVQRRTNKLASWLKVRKKKLVDSSAAMQVKLVSGAAKLQADYESKFDKPLIDVAENKSMGDPFLVVQAEILGGIVVTEEKFAADNARIHKIPNACQFRGIRCIRFLEMIKELGFQYN